MRLLKLHQEQAYHNILKYGKAFIFWPRQTGKSYFLSYIIKVFALNNKSSDILFFVNNKININMSQHKLLNDIEHTVIKKTKKGEINLINNNYITFCSIKDYDHYITYLKPSLIIYDDFKLNNISQFEYLRTYLRESNCRSIFTSSIIDIKIINMLDLNNDYYINIMSVDLPNSIDKFIVEPGIIEQLSYKPDELIDYDDVIFKRRKKLKQLKIINDNIK